MTLRLPDNGANTTPDGRRHAPSAARNGPAILAVLRRAAPARGRLLEIASGSGQHAALMAAELPGLVWQPSDVDPGNLTSINAWAAQSAGQIKAALVLDATAPGWAAQQGGQDVILVVNLLHLISDQAATTVLTEAAQALQPGGVALFYGPFLRDGRATSDGDRAFDADLRAQNPAIGYKDQAWAMAVLTAQGLQTGAEPMPANNLLLMARKPA